MSNHTDDDMTHSGELENIPVDTDAVLEDDYIGMDALNDDGFWLLPSGLASSLSSSSSSSTSASQNSEDSSLESRMHQTSAFDRYVAPHDIVPTAGAVIINPNVPRNDTELQWNTESVHFSSVVGANHRSNELYDVPFPTPIMEFYPNDLRLPQSAFNGGEASRLESVVRLLGDAMFVEEIVDYHRPAVGLGTFGDYPALYQVPLLEPVPVNGTSRMGLAAAPSLFSLSNAATAGHESSTLFFHGMQLSNLLPTPSMGAPSSISSVAALPTDEDNQGRHGQSPCRSKIWLPVRPLNSYNFFFRFERNRLLKLCADHQCKNLEALLDAALAPPHNWHYQLTIENSAELQTNMLLDQWSRDPDNKRKHCKVHGVISFRSLSKRIGKSWGVLPETVSCL